jgi:type II secretory pathway pseudopilin PulG
MTGMYDSGFLNKQGSQGEMVRMRLRIMSDAGFSYVEVLITLVILALAFLVMLPGITSLLVSEAQQESNLSAIALAGNVIEKTKNLDSSGLKLLEESNSQIAKVEIEGREYWIERTVNVTVPDDEDLSFRLWHVDVRVYDVNPELAEAKSKCHLETSIFTAE